MSELKTDLNVIFILKINFNLDPYFQVLVLNVPENEAFLEK
jgi:hypothetical protein